MSKRSLIIIIFFFTVLIGISIVFLSGNNSAEPVSEEIYVTLKTLPNPLHSLANDYLAFAKEAAENPKLLPIYEKRLEMLYRTDGIAGKKLSTLDAHDLAYLEVKIVSSLNGYYDLSENEKIKFLELVNIYCGSKAPSKRDALELASLQTKGINSTEKDIERSDTLFIKCYGR